MRHAQSRAPKNKHLQNGGTKTYLNDFCSQIAELQAEFQHIADLHPWVCLGVPSRGALSTGELAMPPGPAPRIMMNILDPDGKPLALPRPSLKERAAYCKSVRSFRFMGADGKEIEPSIEMVAKAIQNSERWPDMYFNLYGPPPWVMDPKDPKRAAIVEHVRELTLAASQLLFRFLDAIPHMPDDLRQEIRQCEMLEPERGWLSWLRYALVVRGPHNRIENYPQVATTGLMKLRHAISRKIPEAGPLASGPVSEELPRFQDWGIALTEKNKWVLFEREGDKWYHQGKVHVSKGRQHKLLKAFLDGRGKLSRKDALAADGFSLPSGLSEKEKNRMASEGISRINLGSAAMRALRNLRPELSKIRKAIRCAMGISNSNADPLPQDGEKGWAAAIEFGCASNDDNGKLRFRTPDQNA